MPQGVALALSIGIEAAIAATLVARLGWGRPWLAALAAALGTLVTHGTAWNAVLAAMETIGYAASVGLVEAGIVLAESLGYVLIARLPAARALVASAIANAGSTAVGIVLNFLIDG